MDNKLHFAYLSSAIIETYYIKLRELSYQFEEDSPEYTATINKLKKAVEGEAEMYDELTDEEIQEAIKYFDTFGIKNVTESRMRSQLNQTNRIRHDSIQNVTLGNAITAKIIIDVLKRTTFKILKLKDSNLPDDDIECLLLYNDLYKYNYLTGNNYIEKLALDCNYDILSLPNIRFEDIESKFKTEFIGKSAALTLNYIKDSINELLNIKTDDENLRIYMTLFEVSRIETMIPYLNKEALISLSNYLSSLNEHNEALKKIKELVKKRKEEFE